MKTNNEFVNDLFSEEEQELYPNLITLIERFSSGYIQFYIPKGWYSLVNELTGKIEKLNIDYSVSQVKDKFGGLRFYADISRDNHGNMMASDDKIDEFYSMINDYENMSFDVCENCGGKGKSRSHRGWIRTECDDCWESNRGAKTLADLSE